MSDVVPLEQSGVVYLEAQACAAGGNDVADWIYSFTYGYWGSDAARGVEGEVVFESGAEDGSGAMTRAFAIGEAAVSLGETPEALEIAVLSSGVPGDVRVDLPDSGYETLTANGADGRLVFSFRRIGSAGEFFPYDGPPLRRLTFSGLDALTQQSATVSMNVVPPPMPGPVSFRDPFAPFVERVEPIVFGERTMPSADALSGVLGALLDELFATAHVPLMIEVAATYASTLPDVGVQTRVPVALVPTAAVLPPEVVDADAMSVSEFASALGETLATWYETAVPSPGGAFEFDVSVSASGASVPLLRLALVTVPLRGA